MVAHISHQTRLLRQGQEAALHGGDGHDVGGVEVDDALDVGSGLVDGGVQHEPRLVDTEVGGALLHSLPLHVDLDQAAGGHLVVQHPEWVEKKMFCVLTNSCLEKIFH